MTIPGKCWFEAFPAGTYHHRAWPGSTLGLFRPAPCCLGDMAAQILRARVHSREGCCICRFCPISNNQSFCFNRFRQFWNAVVFFHGELVSKTFVSAQAMYECLAGWKTHVSFGPCLGISGFSHFNRSKTLSQVQGGIADHASLENVWKLLQPSKPFQHLSPKWKVSKWHLRPAGRCLYLPWRDSNDCFPVLCTLRDYDAMKVRRKQCFEDFSIFHQLRIREAWGLRVQKFHRGIHHLIEPEKTNLILVEQSWQPRHSSIARNICRTVDPILVE